MSEAMIQVNGVAHPLAGMALLQALQRLGYDTAAAGIAVARNEAIVPRSQWAETTLQAGDRLELVGAVQGG